MISGKISVECPECTGELECAFDDIGDVWNESVVHTAVCNKCDCTMKFWIHAQEPVSARRESKWWVGYTGGR